jgi:hypothetical protein
MSSHDETAFVPGPLDELVPGLRQRGERLPAMPVHPRVLRAVRDDGSYALVFVCFAAPASARAFHAALKPLVEAALLVELCAPAEQWGTSGTRLTSLELFVFCESGLDLLPALAPFGFEATDPLARAASKALALVRGELPRVDGATSTEPSARFTARVAHNPELERAGLTHASLRKVAPTSVFGEEPGLFARVLAELIAARTNSAGAEDGGPRPLSPSPLVIEPSRAGIEALEKLVLQRDIGVVRFMPPFVFQGLCDLIAVAAHARWHMEVEWGVCEVDEETGLAPPPVIRVTRGADTWHVPLGEHVLRWCVMPLSAGEDVPTLGAWAEHEFQ